MDSVLAIVIAAVFISLFIVHPVDADSPKPSILLVEDSHQTGSTNAQVAPYFTAALTANGYTYTTCLVSLGTDDGPGYSAGSPGGSCAGTYMKDFDIVIWFTGKDYTGLGGTTLTTVDQSNLQLFFAGGGKLFLSGQNIGKDKMVGNLPFYFNYLRAYYCIDNQDDDILDGVSLDSVGNNIIGLDIGDGIGNQDSESVVFSYNSSLAVASAEAGVIFNSDSLSYYSGWAGTCSAWRCGGRIPCYCKKCDSLKYISNTAPFDLPGAIKTDNGTYKVVYFAFGFEGIDQGAKANLLMSRVLGYLSAPGVVGETMTPSTTCDPDDSYCSAASNPVLTGTCNTTQHLSNTTAAEYFVDSVGANGAGTAMTATDGTFDEAVEPVTKSIDVSSLSDGTHTVYMHCKDYDAYWGRNTSVTLVVDTIQPSDPANIRINSNNAYTNSEIASLEFSWYSSPSKPDYFAYSCDGSTYTEWMAYPSGDVYAYLNLTSTSAGCSYSDGSRTVYVRLKDLAGNNRTAAASDSITLDRAKPYVSSVSPSNGTVINTTCNLTIDAADTTSGIESIKADNGNETNVTFPDNSGYPHGWSSSGAKRMKLWINDSASNLNYSELSYTVDANAPATTDNTSVAQPWYSANQAVSLTCTDAGAAGCGTTLYCIYDGDAACTPSSTYSSPSLSVECSEGSVCSKRVRYASNDSVGNAESAHSSYIVRIDKQVPSVALNAPVADANLSGSVVVNATISDAGAGVDKVYYNVTNATSGWYYHAPMTRSGETSYWIADMDTTSFQDGSYTVAIDANDTLGNSNSSVSVSVVMDNTAPATSDDTDATEPWYGANRTVTLSCSDATSGCDRVLYCIDASGTCTPSAYATASFEVGCPSGQVCQNYTRYQANDTADNVESAKVSSKIRVDKKAPVITIQSPSSTADYSGVVHVLTTISDGDASGIHTGWYWIFNASDYSQHFQNGSLNASYSWDVDWNSSEYSSGTFILNATANDTVGNEAYLSIAFTVDNLKPSAVIVYPRAIYINQSFSLDLRASRTGGTIANASYYVYNSSVITHAHQNLTVSQQQYSNTDSISVAAMADGNYSLNFSAYDDIGNNATDATWFWLDTQAPSTTDSTDPAVPWYASDRSVTLSCSDAGSGCSSTYYCVDYGGSCTPSTKYAGAFSITCPSGNVCQNYTRYMSNDTVGNAGPVAQSSLVKIDRERPVTTSNASSSWSSSNVSINFTWTESGSGRDATVYCVDSSQSCSPVSVFSYGTYVPVGCDSGQVCYRYVRFRSNDSVGNTEDVRTSVSIRVDKSIPSVIIVSPSSRYLAGSFYATANVTDNGIGVDKVRYNVSNATWSSTGYMTMVSGTTFWNATIATSSMGDGDYNVSVIANDSVGNLNSTEYARITVDNTAPVASAYAFNATNDAAYGDVRAYVGSAVRFSVNVSDATNVSHVIVTVSGTNYTMSAQGSSVNGTWYMDWNCSTVGLYNISDLYVNDTLGNSRANASVSMPLRVVNGSLSVLVNATSAVEASHNATLNLTFGFNKTVSSPSMLVYIPPNNASNYTQTPWYVNTTSYIGSFGSSQTITYSAAGTRPARLSFTGVGSGASAMIQANVTATTPSEDTQDNWTLAYGAYVYSGQTSIRTPYLNISSVVCSGGACTVEQNANFTVSATIDNNQTSAHSGVARSVWASMSSACSGSASLGNISSGSSNSTSAAGWTCNLTSAGTSTVLIDAGDASGAYNATQKSVTIQVMDTEPPGISSIAYADDNIINVNESLVYKVTASDNVNVSSVWVSINKSGTVTNATMAIQTGTPKLAVWNLTYSDTETAGNFTIPAIYANDTRGNIVTSVPSGDYSRFEVRSMSLSAALSSSSQTMGQSVTSYANVSGNASSISSVTGTVQKPNSPNETITLSQTAYSGGVYQFAKAYSNVTRSGTYNVTANASISSGIYMESSSSFTVPYANASLQSESGTLYLPVNGGSFNLTVFLMPEGGDLVGVNATISIGNESVINITAGQSLAQAIGNVFYEDYSAGYPVTWEVSVDDLGETDISVNANSTTPSTSPNASASISISVIPEDTGAPTVNSVGQQWNYTNLLGANRITINATDNMTAIANVTVSMRYPSGESYNYTASKVGVDTYRLSFTGTNQTGNFSYVVYASDLSGNMAWSSQNSFIVVSAYTVTLTPEHTTYNKGENVTVNFTVTDVNGQDVAVFNATMLVNKGTVVNTTILQNIEAPVGYFEPQPSDNPTTSTPSTYYVYGNVSKDGNSGAAAALTLTVTKLIRASIVNPSDGDYFAINSSVAISVTVANTRGDTIDSARSVTAKCTNCNGTEDLYEELRWNETTQRYTQVNAFNAPSTSNNKFSVFVYANDYGGNDQSGSPSILLTTTRSSGSDQGGSGGTGAAAAGGGGGGGCVYNKAELTVNGNCDDGVDNDCDGKTDCSDDECATALSCIKVERSFEFSLDSDRQKIVQGTKSIFTGTLKNTGNVDLELTFTTDKGCCTLAFETTVKLKPKESRAISIEAYATLTEAPGEYAVKITASTAGAAAKSDAITLIVTENALVATIRQAKAEIMSLEKELESYNASGIDVSGVREKLSEIKGTLQAGEESIKKDDVKSLQESASKASSDIFVVQATLKALGIQKFIFDNRFGLVSGLLVSIILAYLIVEVTWPYYKLGKDVKKAQSTEASLVEARKQAEVQYFSRKIDERTFESIVKEKQSQILQARGVAKLKADERRGFIKGKLAPKSFAVWIASAPKGLKRRIVRKKKDALPPLPWEK